MRWCSGRGTSGVSFDGEAELEAIAGFEAQMAEANFWDDQVSAQRVIADLNRFEGEGGSDSAILRVILRI